MNQKLSNKPLLAIRPAKPLKDDGRATVLDREVQKVEPPPLYRVILLNDDFTPMEFVVHVLENFFNHPRQSAMLLMLKVHHEGRAICGVFTKDIAATKVDTVLTAAQKAGHPLQCTMEAL
jgi:ATP-dependent Clp protease adaptor protein ClpS